VKISLTPQMVRVVLTAVEFAPLDVWRTSTTSPLLTVPAAAVHAHPLILYCHPAQAIVMALAESIPATVIGADCMSVLSATLF